MTPSTPPSTSSTGRQFRSTAQEIVNPTKHSSRHESPSHQKPPTHGSPYSKLVQQARRMRNSDEGRASVLPSGTTPVAAPTPPPPPSVPSLAPSSAITAAHRLMIYDSLSKPFQEKADKAAKRISELESQVSSQASQIRSLHYQLELWKSEYRESSECRLEEAKSAVRRSEMHDKYVDAVEALVSKSSKTTTQYINGIHDELEKLIDENTALKVENKTLEMRLQRATRRTFYT